MKLNEINIRDPYVLVYGGKYYMYGTRGNECWNDEAFGFDVYISEDLENWSGPKTIFEREESFWGRKNFWAPEVYYYNGAFYMFASFKAENRHRATVILRSDSPNGMFKVYADGITPEDWECLDGTLYIEDGVPYMVFCHEWTQVSDGEICAVRLKEDLSGRDSEPFVLFRASEADWAVSVSEDGKNYVSDGPFLMRLKNGSLIMLWSSFGKNGYVQAVSRSDNGKINGKWENRTEDCLFDRDGGHGMIFTAKEGEKYLVIHSPNKRGLERPRFIGIGENEERIYIKTNYKKSRGKTEKV